MPEEATEDRDPESFAGRLRFHMNRGTRPKGKIKVWTVQAFADAVDTTGATVYNWRAGKNLPNDLFRVEAVLFGDDPNEDDPTYKKWRGELKDAFDRGRGTIPSKLRSEAADGSATKEASDGVGPNTPGAARSEILVSNFKAFVPAYFCGRQEELEKIEAVMSLQEERPARVILYGMPGVGKTVTAHAYVARNAPAYRAIWQIDARTSSTMRAGLVGLGLRLGWANPDQLEDVAIDAVMDQLVHNGEGMLLIYENAFDAKTVRPFLPAMGKARAIILTNDYAWRSLGETFEVRNWNEAIGARFLIERSGDHAASPSKAAELSTMLGGLPLAHEQAAAYCEEKEQVSLEDYIELFNLQPIELLADSTFAPVEYGRTVAKTFNLAVLAAKEQHPAAEWLISLASMFAPEPIPVFMLSEAVQMTESPFATELVGDGFEKALRILRAFALIDRPQIGDHSSAIDCLQLHRLVHEIVSSRVSDEDRQTMTRTLIRITAGMYPGELSMIPSSWAGLRFLEPHASHLVKNENVFVDDTDGIEGIFLINGLATYLQNVRHSYKEARELFERCSSIMRRLKVSPLLTATVANNFGFLLNELGEYERSLYYLNEALQCREQLLGENHGEVAVVLNNIGLSYYRQNKLGEALRAFHRAIRIYAGLEKGEFDAAKASCANNAASVFMDIGEVAKAADLFQASLNIGVATHGYMNFGVAATLSNLGLALEWLDRPMEAKPHYELALKIHDALYGREDPRCIELTAKLAALDNEIGNND